MAENIGKVQISIEAQTEQLVSGLKSAENAVKDSAKKMEIQQNKLGNRFKKSWVELSGKINVFVMALNSAEKAVGVFAESMRILGDDSKDALEKTAGILDAFRTSGIPIISQFVGIAHGLASAFSGYGEEMQKLVDLQNELVESTREYNRVIRDSAMVDSIQLQLLLQQSRTRISSLEVMPTEKDEYNIFHERRAMERLVIETRLQKQISSIENIAIQDRAIVASKAIMKQFDLETAHRLNKLDLYLEKKASLERTIERELEQRKIDNSKAVADKTLDLQTKLNIMLAKQAGDEEKAKLLAIEARYKKEIEEATKATELLIKLARLAGDEERAIELELATVAQKNLLLQMKAIEIAGAMEKAIVEEVAKPEVQKAMGGTASIATAIGGFTVATGVNKELMQAKKQTTLLETIAYNTAPRKGDAVITVAT